MVALAATDVTVTISQRDVEDRPGFLRHVIALLSFGDGALTYPAGGVPLPAIGNFGFKKSIKFGIVQQPYQHGMLFDYRYDADNHKLKICGVSELASHAGPPTAGATKLFEIPATETPGATKVYVLFWGE